MINLLSLYLPFISTAGAAAAIDFPEHSTATQSSGVTCDLWLDSLLVDFFHPLFILSSAGKTPENVICDRTEVLSHINDKEQCFKDGNQESKRNHFFFFFLKMTYVKDINEITSRGKSFPPRLQHAWIFTGFAA